MSATAIFQQSALVGPKYAHSRTTILLKVKPAVTEMKISYPILLDPGRKVNQLFIIEAIPRNFIDKRDGKLASQAIHLRTRNQFLAIWQSWRKRD